MKALLTTLYKIIPEGMSVLQRRYDILKGIRYLQPIGRRTLSGELHISERILRSDTDFLKKDGLIQVSSIGMVVTDEGEAVIHELEDLMHILKGLSSVEQRVSELLKVPKVIVVSGNADENEVVKKDIGKVAAGILREKLENSSIVAITGGSTVAQVVNAVIPSNSGCEDTLVVPARGSLGTKVEYQANTLASQLAQRIGARYQLLNLPDNLSKKALEHVRDEPQIQATLEKISQANILIFGIGNAMKMAQRRSLSDTVIDFLQRKKAVAEAFGYYFSEDGEIIYTSRSIGVKLEKMKRLPYTIAVAGGASKARSIHATAHLFKNGCLIIDEGAAKEILRIMS